MVFKAFVCVFALSALSVISRDAHAQTFSTLTYSSDNTNFPNPERGFYRHTEAHSNSYFTLQPGTLRDYPNEGISLILRVFYLEDFVHSDIAGQYLDNMQIDFDACRVAGVKMIIRFAYTTRSVEPYGDATPERVLSHIRQLTPVLRDNSDVITIVQAGFIGAWGEWYFTDHFKTNSLGNITEANWRDRIAVVDALLEALPDHVVQVTTPSQKRRITGSQEAVTPGEAFSLSRKARIGHHNDCFISSPNDVGTYNNIAEEKNYLEQETRYLPMGGETCAVYPPYSECPNALSEMERFHWSYLNIGYHPNVIANLEADGCMNDVRRKLGYRLRLASSKLQTSGMPGGAFDLELTLINDGWAGIYRARPAEIVLRNITTHREYFFPVTNDVRTWSLTDSIKMKKQIGLPENIEAGTYAVYLNLPDPDARLYGNPDFSIRMANENVWNSTLGYNDLQQILVIDQDETHPVYEGDDLFEQRDQLIAGLEPSPVLATASAKAIIAYWGNSANDPFRVIERADASGVFSTVATIPGHQAFFRDNDVMPNHSYTYRYFFKDIHGVSVPTEAVTINSRQSDPLFYKFTTDGDRDEWRSIAPVATTVSDNDTYALRFFATRDSLHIMLEGKDIQQYGVYLDSDNSSATGQSWAGSSYTGFDYRLSNDSLYRSIHGAWVFRIKVRQHTDAVKEIAVQLTELHNLGLNTNLAFSSCLMIAGEAHVFPAASAAGTFYRALPSATPENFRVANAVLQPETMIIVQWSGSCDKCEGFVLERSTSADSDFQQVFATSTETIFRDDNRTPGITYFYRMASYNSTGLSYYTAIASATPNAVTGISTQLARRTAVYPNPARREVYVRQTGEKTDGSISVRVFDTMGRELATPALLQSDARINVYNVEYLTSGIYLLRIVQGDNHFFYRLLK